MNKIARIALDSSLLVFLFVILIVPITFLGIGGYESAPVTPEEQNVLPSSDYRQESYIEIEPVIEEVEESEESTESTEGESSYYYIPDIY